MEMPKSKCLSMEVLGSACQEGAPAKISSTAQQSSNLYTIDEDAAAECFSTRHGQ